MRTRWTLSLVFLAIFPTLIVVNRSSSNQAVSDAEERMQYILTSHTSAIINNDGDVSLTDQQNRNFWNPHSTGLTDASTWTVTFNGETEIFLKTAPDEAGHVATGAWWTSNFKSNEKLPLYTSKPVRVLTTFQVNVADADCESGEEWLRMALASAVQRVDGSVIYTEIDFWDSPCVLTCPSGNIKSGGNIVYDGGDVVEYKIDQTPLGKWSTYSLDLTAHINSAWLLKPGDVLESVYIVVEVVGQVTVDVKVDNFWIACLD